MASSSQNQRDSNSAINRENTDVALVDEQGRGGGHGGYNRGRPRNRYRGRGGSDRARCDRSGIRSGGDDYGKRPKLALLKRSKSIETPEAAFTGSSSIFGGAKPVDTTARDREIEQKLNRLKVTDDRTTSGSSQILPQQANGWGQALINNVDAVATWGNHKKTRILIISTASTSAMDINYVENILKKDGRTNKIVYDYFSIRTCNNRLGDQESFTLKHSFEDFGPTGVVLTFKHETTGNEFKEVKSTPPRSPTFVLETADYISQIQLIQPHYLFMETRNVWHREECILTSLTSVTKQGVREKLKEAMRKNLLKNSEKERVLIISGGDGERKKNDRVTPAGGESCFTNINHLKHRYYEHDCITIGIKPGKEIVTDFDTDPNDPNKKIVTCVDQTQPKPDPDEKPKFDVRSLQHDAEPLNEIKGDNGFDKVCFDVLDIAHYGIYDPTTKESNIKGLVTYLTKYKPTFILIGFCFSSNGDLAVSLRGQGFFSKLLLEHELRTITMDMTAKLSDEQVQVLWEAAARDSTGKKPKYKNFHLYGSSGTGKTLLMIEIGKILLAQLCQDLPQDTKINLCILAQASLTKNPAVLITMLESKISDLVSAYPINLSLKNQISSCENTEILSDKIKEAIKEMDQTKPSVLLIDEVTINPVEGDFNKVQDFTPKYTEYMMKDNVWCVYAHSPLTASASGHPFKIVLPKLDKYPDVHSVQLHYRYRYCKEILEFLKFVGSEGLTVTSTLNEDDDVEGDKLPPNPNGFLAVLWMECDWNCWDTKDQKFTIDMLHSLKQFQTDSVMVIGMNTKEITGLEEEKYWRWIDERECAGLEEDIVVYVADATIEYEPLSRARKYLIILTGTSLTSRSKSILDEALYQHLLEKKSAKKAEKENFRVVLRRERYSHNAMY